MLIFSFILALKNMLFLKKFILEVKKILVGSKKLRNWKVKFKLKNRNKLK